MCACVCVEKSAHVPLHARIRYVRKLVVVVFLSNLHRIIMRAQRAATCIMRIDSLANSVGIRAACTCEATQMRGRARK